MTRPIHPLVLKAVPETSEADRSKMREGIRKNGLIQPIVISAGFIIDGRTRQQICDEIGVKARYIEYDDALPIAEYILQTNLRRNITEAQMDAMIVTLAQEVVPAMREEARKAIAEGRARGTEVTKGKKGSVQNDEQSLPPRTYDVQRRLRAIVGSTAKADAVICVIKHPDLAESVEQGAISLKRAHTVALDRHRGGPKIQKTPTAASENRIKWQATIDSPSTFPVDAIIPEGLGPQERQVREAIRIARENEGGIGGFGRGKLQTLIWENTNCIQGYFDNWHNRERPEGLLDPRLNEWAKDVARKHQARQLIIQEHEIVNRANGTNGSHGASKKPSKKKLTGFEAVFRKYLQKEKPLLRDLRMYGFETFSERWLKDIGAYFAEVESK